MEMLASKNHDLLYLYLNCIFQNTGNVEYQNIGILEYGKFFFAPTLPKYFGSLVERSVIGMLRHLKFTYKEM